jgi:hypothetical protein
MRMDVYAHGCIRCSISTRIGIRTELFENDRPMILGWIVTRVVRLRAVLVRVRLGSLHFCRKSKLPPGMCCIRRQALRESVN